MELPKIHAGKVLLAKPTWNDETWSRSIIVLIDHTDYGTSGVMVNKQSNLSVNDCLPELEHYQPMYYGGPVNKKTISYLHGRGDLTDALYLGNGLYWGGQYIELQAWLKKGKVKLDRFHFMAGFAQWSPGQLATELNKDMWWVAEMSLNDLLSRNKNQMWGDLLIELGHPYGLVSEFPDPSAN